MKITSAEFIKSAFEKRHWVSGGLPEIAFLGRSNVGKSSLINSLLQRKGLAKASNTPGRTQSVNFFLINESFNFADLPGYGFARVSRSKRSDWGKMAEDYLADRRELVLSIQLIDARHEPTMLDRQLNEWLNFYQKPYVIAATKADKISNNLLTTRLRSISQLFSGSKVIACSAQTGKGREELWAVILEAVKKRSEFS